MFHFDSLYCFSSSVTFLPVLCWSYFLYEILIVIVGQLYYILLVMLSNLCCVVGTYCITSI